METMFHKTFHKLSKAEKRVFISIWYP